MLNLGQYQPVDIVSASVRIDDSASKETKPSIYNFGVKFLNKENIDFLLGYKFPIYWTKKRKKHHETI